MFTMKRNSILASITVLACTGLLVVSLHAKTPIKTSNVGLALNSLSWCPSGNCSQANPIVFGQNDSFLESLTWCPSGNCSNITAEITDDSALPVDDLNWCPSGNCSTINNNGLADDSEVIS